MTFYHLLLFILKVQGVPYTFCRLKCHLALKNARILSLRNFKCLITLFLTITNHATSYSLWFQTEKTERRQGITQRRIRRKNAEKIKEEENIVRSNFQEVLDLSGRNHSNHRNTQKNQGKWVHWGDHFTFKMCLANQCLK